MFETDEACSRFIERFEQKWQAIELNASVQLLRKRFMAFRTTIHDIRTQKHEFESEVIVYTEISLLFGLRSEILFRNPATASQVTTKLTDEQFNIRD